MITQSQGSTVQVTINDGPNAGQVIDMVTRVGALIPVLFTTSLLALIRNTSSTFAHDGTGTVVYRWMIKPNTTVYINYDNKAKKHVMVLDPRKAPFKNLEEGIVRLVPKYVGHKAQILAWDKTIDTIQGLLAQQIAAFMNNRRVEKQKEAFDIILDRVSKIKFTGNPTTFKTGAHIEIMADGYNADKAYQSFASARSLLAQIGLNNAPGKENKEYGHSAGIPLNDMLAILSYEFEATIKTKRGLFNSIPGYAAFTSFDFQSILGVPTISSANLPENVNFIFLTTGIQGVLGYEQVGPKIGASLISDPDAYGSAWLLNMWDYYILDVVLPFQALVSIKKMITPPKEVAVV